MTQRRGATPNNGMQRTALMLAVSRQGKGMSETVEMSTSLKRPICPMPGFVKQALEERELMADYRARPAYQQNDYIRWINNAKLPETKGKRLHQMLEELEKGGVYMKMSHHPSRKNK